LKGTTFTVSAGAKVLASTNNGRVTLDFTGNITINGEILADECGHPSDEGPGAGKAGTGIGGGGGGSAYSGGDGDSNPLSAGIGYMYIESPFGSGGGSAVAGCVTVLGGGGGGAIRIKAGGTVTIGKDGLISADGQDGQAALDCSCGSGGGGGGTVHIQADALVSEPGEGTISFVGGNGGVATNSGGGGGGGRFILNVEANQFQGTIRDEGGGPESNSGQDGCTYPNATFVQLFVFFPVGGYCEPSQVPYAYSALVKVEDYLESKSFHKHSDKIWWKETLQGTRYEVYIFYEDYHLLSDEDARFMAEYGRKELRRALETLESYVVYIGHSNFGLGPAFALKPDWFKQGREEVELDFTYLNIEDDYTDWDGNTVGPEDFELGCIKEGTQYYKDRVRIAEDTRGALNSALAGDEDIRDACFECYFMGSCSTEVHFLDRVIPHNPQGVILFTKHVSGPEWSPKIFVEGVIENKSWVDIVIDINNKEPHLDDGANAGAGDVEGQNKLKARLDL
jgi:hypothetical protein